MRSLLAARASRLDLINLPSNSFRSHQSVTFWHFFRLQQLIALKEQALTIVLAMFHR